MRAVVQRISEGKVVVDEKTTGEIKRGLLVYLGVGPQDTSQDVKYMADKLVNLRIFSDENDKMNLSLLDVAGELLLVSQFTLYGDCRKGRRPNFTEAGKPEVAEALYQELARECAALGVPVQQGVFQAHMEVHAVNDGPVTIMLDSKKCF